MAVLNFDKKIFFWYNIYRIRKEFICMDFKNTRAYNFEGAFHGMRNPMNSWNRSDSQFCLTDIYMDDTLTEVCDAWIENENIERRERGAE